MKNILFLIGAFVPILSFSQTMPIATDNGDIRVFPSDHMQSETHISVNKTNPNNLIYSANTYTSTYSQGYYYSVDGGISWAGGDDMPRSGTSDGDPTTCYDASGNGYIAGMIPAGTTVDGYFVQITNDGGYTWTPQIRGTGPTPDFDKEMEITIDEMQTSPYVNYYYCAWTDFSDPHQRVKVNRSTSMGSSYSSPIILSTGWGQGTNVQTGPNGEVYVCWADYTSGSMPAQNIGFAYSSNGGVSYTTSLAFPYSGIRLSNSGDPKFGNTRVNDFPAMAVDKSCGKNRGRIYVTYPEFDAGGTTKSIIRVRYSDDHGVSWSNPVTVNIPKSTENWFPWIAVDDLTGLVNVTYFAFDDPSNPTSTNTYVAYSTDGGSTWVNIKVSDVPHTTAPINNSLFAEGYAGDYIGITSFGGKSYAAWYDNRSGKWQAYCSRIDYSISNIVSSQTNLKIDAPPTLFGTTTYQATQQITAADVSPVATGVNSDITFRAGKSVTLDPGFQTDPKLKKFLAYIDNVEACTTPGAQFYKSTSPPGGNINNVITSMSGDKDIYAYPVPATSFITIGCYNSIAAKTITIRDISGKTILQVPVSIYNNAQLRNTIDISSLSPGNYIYSIDFKDRPYSGKFIKN